MLCGKTQTRARFWPSCIMLFLHHERHERQTASEHDSHAPPRQSLGSSALQLNQHLPRLNLVTRNRKGLFFWFPRYFSARERRKVYSRPDIGCFERINGRMHSRYLCPTLPPAAGFLTTHSFFFSGSCACGSQCW